MYPEETTRFPATMIAPVCCLGQVDLRAVVSATLMKYSVLVILLPFSFFCILPLLVGHPYQKGLHLLNRFVHIKGLIELSTGPISHGFHILLFYHMG